jgi:hypothetical protein
MIVSDGCGQLTTETKPSWWLTRVLMRTNNVLMDAVRRNSYRIVCRIPHCRSGFYQKSDC